MKVACVLSGFIRNIDNIKNLSVFFNNINNEKLETLTVFYSIPNKIEEDYKDLLDEEYITNLFKKEENNKLKINIRFRDYQKEDFIKYGKELNLPYLLPHKYHTYRILSCMNGLSESASVIDNENYDFIIFSRLDIINYILSITVTHLKNEAYIWRTIPYMSQGELSNHVEDRFFICSVECIEIIKSLYQSIKNLNIDEKDFGAEIIIGKQFNTYKNIKKYHINDTEININKTALNLYAGQRVKLKYSKVFIDNH